VFKHRAVEGKQLYDLLACAYCTQRKSTFITSAGGGPDQLVVFVALRPGSGAEEPQLRRACQVHGKAACNPMIDNLISLFHLFLALPWMRRFLQRSPL
jgi:hypothetical protein